MKQRFNINDLEAGQLNNRCLRILTTFTRALFNTTGVSLQLRDPDLLKKVHHYARTNNDPQLSDLHAQLAAAVLEYVRGKDFEDKRSRIMRELKQRKDQASNAQG